MKVNKIKYFVYYLLSACIFTLSSCATIKIQRTPIKIYPNFQDIGINTIYLIPVVDQRHDRSVPYPFEGFEFSTMLTGTATVSLENKGYQVDVKRTSTGSYKSLSSIEAKNINSMEYHKLGSNEDDYVLIIFLDEVTSGRNVWRMKASGMLYSKKLKTRIWEDKITEHGAGMVSSVTDDGIKSLLSTLPDNLK
ncbi:hypothetical protein JW887_03615 [Candidatus Dojkabacteria bacterium]|nr:hypothetical protein [Candidatus Dojkabacteria bacterium]